jgi:hypothetical protein
MLGGTYERCRRGLNKTVMEAGNRRKALDRHYKPLSLLGEL